MRRRGAKAEGKVLLLSGLEGHTRDAEQRLYAVGVDAIHGDHGHRAWLGTRERRGASCLFGAGEGVGVVLLPPVAWCCSSEDERLRYGGVAA